jgi:hypothetical protein
VRYSRRMAKTVPLSHRLDPELKAELQRLADADRRSLTNFIEIILIDYVEKHGNENKRQNLRSGKR